MPKARKKSLPKDVEALLGEGDFARLKSVFETCEVDARGGYSKQSALAFADCPDALARWLVSQGADIEARDSYGETPLHSRAGHWRGEIGVLLELGADVHAIDSRGNTPLHHAARVGSTATVQLLLAHGARTDIENNRGDTPLGLALAECSNARIAEIAAVATILMQARPPTKTGLGGLVGRLLGARPSSPATSGMKAEIQRIGADFEFHRTGFNPELLPAASAGLDKLYALFDVTPVPRRVLHSGDAPIVASATGWEERHKELWDRLVPSSGAAATAQGEVIRITGRMHIEIEANGAVNWDADYGKMGKALLVHLGSGEALPEADLRDAAALVAEVRRRDGAAAELCRLAVAWVALNPAPLPLATPDYRR